MVVVVGVWLLLLSASVISMSSSLSSLLLVLVPVTSEVTCRFLTSLWSFASAVSSWKCVANSA